MGISADVVIVGGGIIGCSLAYSLGKRGARVIVVDQGAIGAQASQAASGMLAPLKPYTKPKNPYTTLLLHSLALYPTMAAELEDVSGISVGYHQTGSLRLMRESVTREKQMIRLKKWVDEWRAFNYPLEVVIGDALRTYEPGLSLNISLGVYNPIEPQLHSMQIIQAFARAAEQLGTRFYPYQEVTRFCSSGSRVAEIETVQGERIVCDHLVIATGAWSQFHGEWLGIQLPVRPLRAQSLAVGQSSPPLRHMLFGEGIYLAPKPDRIIVGVVREDVGFRVDTTPEGCAWLYDAAKRLVPSLGENSILDAWSGLLPDTPDARPIVGSVPGWQNVTLACGYNGFGVLLAAGVGELLTDMVISGHISELLQPFLIDRFIK